MRKVSGTLIHVFPKRVTATMSVEPQPVAKQPYAPWTVVWESPTMQTVPHFRKLS